MRTVEFRGKRTDNGEWVYGFVRRQYDDTGMEYVFITTQCGDEYEVNPATVGQFTDCVDKNGDPIFEGDILHYEGQRSDNKGKHYRRAIVFHHGAFKFRLEDGRPGDCIGGGNTWLWDIVGNIHDNEL